MNFSISELAVVFLVALLVIKPEQLPDVAYTLGKLAKKVRALFSKMKDEMSDLVEPVNKTNERQ